MFAQHNGVSHLLLHCYCYLLFYSGIEVTSLDRETSPELLVMFIFKCPSCQTFILENRFGRVKKGSYQHILNSNLESKKQKINST